MDPEREGASLAARLGHTFSDPSLLRRALTHRSHSSDHNERLEFLGDALIGLIVGETLFESQPRASEGDLSRLRASLVRERSLAKIAQRLDVGAALRLGEGERKSGGWRRASVLADTLEALVAAVYLDSDYASTRALCRRLFDPELRELPDAESLKDAKTRLQEWLQARGRPVPVYEVLAESGPAHRRVFRVQARLPDASDAEQAEGPSRRRAEQRAAGSLLERLSGELE